MRRRTILIWFLLSAIAFNLIFFYVKTRPAVPSAYLEFGFSIADEEQQLREQKAVMLSSDGDLRSADGQPMNLFDALIFALPNTDSVDYSVVVRTNGSPTFGDTIRIIRALASEGICNFTFLENFVDESRTPYVPPLTISDYTLIDGDKLLRCKSSPEVSARFRSAKAEFDRKVMLRRQNSAK